MFSVCDCFSSSFYFSFQLLKLSGSVLLFSRVCVSGKHSSKTIEVLFVVYAVDDVSKYILISSALHRTENLTQRGEQKPFNVSSFRVLTLRSKFVEFWRLDVMWEALPGVHIKISGDEGSKRCGGVGRIATFCEFSIDVTVNPVREIVICTLRTLVEFKLSYDTCFARDNTAGPSRSGDSKGVSAMTSRVHLSERC